MAAARGIQAQRQGMKRPVVRSESPSFGDVSKSVGLVQDWYHRMLHANRLCRSGMITLFHVDMSEGTLSERFELFRTYRYKSVCVNPCRVGKWQRHAFAHLISWRQDKLNPGIRRAKTYKQMTTPVNSCELKSTQEDCVFFPHRSR